MAGAGEGEAEGASRALTIEGQGHLAHGVLCNPVNNDCQRKKKGMHLYGNTDNDKMCCAMSGQYMSSGSLCHMITASTMHICTSNTAAISALTARSYMSNSHRVNASMCQGR